MQYYVKNYELKQRVMIESAANRIQDKMPHPLFVVIEELKKPSPAWDTMAPCKTEKIFLNI
jgi:hypothetical protein